MTLNLKYELITFLQANKDIFVWSPSNILGISPKGITHQLKLNKNHRSVRQKLRFMSTEKKAAIEGEVGKLLKAEFVKEEKYLIWLANVVMVRKPMASGKCVLTTPT